MSSKIIEVDQARPSFIETARRAQIIDCAVQAIAELGYAQASLAQIAKRARISAGVISYYFAGKDDLIAAVVSHIFAAGDAFVRPRVMAKTSARAMLAEFIAASVAFAAAHPAQVAAMVEISVSVRAAHATPPFDRAAVETRAVGLSMILDGGKARGEFRQFSTPIMTDAIIEAIDMRAVRPGGDPDLFAAELITLFDLATRAASLDAPEGDSR
jgi:AcrR family transcriptional regulator